MRRTQGNVRNVSNSGDYSANGSVQLAKILKVFSRLRDESKDTLVLVGSPQWVLSQIEKFSDQIRDPTIAFSHTRTSGYQMVKRRPELKYQFGLVDTVPETDLKTVSLQNRQVRDNLTASSGFSISALNFSFGYNKGITTNYVWGRNNTKSISQEYPDLSLAISRVEKLPFLSKYITTSSLNTSFNQITETRGDFQPDSALNVTEESKTYEFSPLASWQASWKKGVTSSIDLRYSQGYTINYYGGMLQTNRKTQGVDASLAYSFSAPSGINIPLLRRIHFTSTLTVNLTAGYSEHQEWIPNTATVYSDYSTFSSRLGLSYQFSSSINGGTDIDYSQNKDNNRNVSTKIVGMNFWVLFLF